MRLLFTYFNRILTLLVRVLLANGAFALLASLPGVTYTQNCSHIIEPVPDHALLITPSLLDNLKPGDTICFAAGDFRQILIRNIHGTPDSVITLRNAFGRVRINNNAHYGIAFHNSSHIKLLGNGSPEYDYGLAILGVGHGNGISIDQKSTNIEVGYVEIANVGLSGIMVKTDPKCDDLSAVRDSFALYETIIHNCYIHNVGNEGLYLGSSFYGGIPLNCNGNDTVVLPHELIGVQIYNNIFKRTGRNTIQVSSATADCFIHDNLILEDSQSGISFHMNAIQVGGGSRCNVFNNFIVDGKGGGIHYFGQGPGMIFNNLIVNPGRSHYPDLPPNQFPVHGMLIMHTYTETNDPVHIFHNTIFNPKTDGIRFTNNFMEGSKIQNNIIINPGAFAHIGQDAFLAIFPESIDAIVSHNFLDTHAGNIYFSDTFNLDFSLSYQSPAINAGVDLQDYGITFDITGAPRPSGIAPDLGAYECQQSFLNESGNKQIDMEIYPNPSGDFINVDIKDCLSGMYINILMFDIAGNLVFEYVFFDDSLVKKIPVYHLRAGKYIIVAHAGNKRGVGTFVRKATP